MSAHATSDAISDVAVGTMFGLTATEWGVIVALSLAVITFAGLLITRWQNRAMLLLEMDRRWLSQEMLEARRLVRDLRDDLIKRVATDHAELDDVHKTEKLGEEFAKALAQMLAENRDDYHLALRYCGFFETIGLMVRRGYIPLDDIDDLLHGAIMSIDECFRTHIHKRQHETGVTSRMFEHALYLTDRVKKRSKSRT